MGVYTNSFSPNTKIKSSEVNQNFTDVWPQEWLSVAAPTWTATGGAPAFGNANVTNYYSRIGDTIFWHLRIQFGNTSTFAGTSWRWTLPINAHASAVSSNQLGIVYYFDDNTSVQGQSLCQLASATTIGVVTIGAATTWGVTVPITWAANDIIIICITYRAA